MARLAALTVPELRRLENGIAARSHEQTLTAGSVACSDVALGSNSDLLGHARHVRFTPDSY